MQVNELFEGTVKFSVEHRNGRHRRVYTCTASKIIDGTLFSQAEKKRIMKLAVSETFGTKAIGSNGQTIITVTRTQ